MLRHHVEFGCICPRTNKIYTIPERGHWKQPIYGRVAIIGSLIGYGTFIGFPELFFEYKGVALLPFTIMFVLVGIPLFALELGMGQHVNLGPVKAFASLAPILTGVGWGMIVISFITTVYYNLYITTSLLLLLYYVWHFMGFSDNEEILKDKCKFLTDAEFQPSDFTTLQLTVFLLSWFFVAVIISKGYQSLGKVIFVLNVIPYFLMLPLLIFKFLSPTSEKVELKDFFVFDWNEILDKEMWIIVTKHVLFNLGIAFGIRCTLASYNKSNQHFLLDSVWLPLLDVMTSIVCFILIYEHFAEKDKNALLILCNFPEHMYKDKVAVLIHLTFYLMGYSCQIAMVEVVVTAILDQFQVLRNFHALVVYITCGLLGLVGFYTCIRPDYFTFLNTTSTSVMFYFALALAFSGPFFCLQFENVKQHLQVKVNKYFEIYLMTCWSFVSPIILTVIVVLHFQSVIGHYTLKQSLYSGLCILLPGIFTFFNCIPLKFKEYFQPTAEFNRSQEHLTRCRYSSSVRTAAEENSRV